ncbi:MAG: hypothetical protein ABI273_03445 [Lacunisphaera sp.]
MKDADYFRQAFDDADFRREKILDLRERKKFAFYFLISGVLIMIVLSLASSLSDGKWLMTLSSGFSTVILMVMIYTDARTRLVALEAMNRIPMGSIR